MGREAFADAQLFEALPCSSKTTFCGAHLESEELSSLGVGSALHIAEDQDGPKVFGHFGENGLHPARGLPALGVTGRVGVGIGDLRRVTGDPLADPGAATVLCEYASSDRKHPRCKLLVAMDGVNAAQHNEKDFLGRMVGIHAWPSESPAPLKDSG
jgi:hypothetical protein